MPYQRRLNGLIWAWLRENLSSFGVSNQVRLKPTCSATDTVPLQRLARILKVAWSKFRYYTFQLANYKGADQTAPLLFAHLEDRFSRVEANLTGGGMHIYSLILMYLLQVLDLVCFKAFNIIFYNLWQIMTSKWFVTKNVFNSKR